MARPLTEQEKKPHPSLIEVRNSIEVALGETGTRRKAANIANQLTHDQCDKVVEANGDTSKVMSAIKTTAQKVQSDEDAEKESKASKSTRKNK